MRFRENTLAEVRNGTIPIARIDDAVTRILRVKALAGLFNAGNAAARVPNWDATVVGAPAHRAIAREAVSRSLVLLKNAGHVLPVKPRSHVLVAGVAADDIGQQCGGWTIDWQGDHNRNEDFPGATSIYAGIRDAVSAAGGSAEYSAAGQYSQRPDVALVVFGERPYAEYDGDREALRLGDQDEQGLALMRRLREQGIPVVAVMITGRPLWVNAELNAADAFVVAWLPGTEGSGVADVLVADAAGLVRQDFRGRLPFGWPSIPTPVPHSVSGVRTGELFARGYGLNYSSPGRLPRLDERPAGTDDSQTSVPLFTANHVVAPWSLFLEDPIGDLRDTMQVVESQTRVLNVSIGSDGLEARWHSADGAELIVAGRARDLSPAVRPNATLLLTYRVDSAPSDKVFLGVRCGLPYGAPPEVPAGASRHCALSGEGAMRDVTAAFRTDMGSWKTIAVPMRCFAGADLRYVGTPFALRTDGTLGVTLKDVRLLDVPADAEDCASVQVRNAR